MGTLVARTCKSLRRVDYPWKRSATRTVMHMKLVLPGVESVFWGGLNYSDQNAAADGILLAAMF